MRWCICIFIVCCLSSCASQGYQQSYIISEQETAPNALFAHTDAKDPPIIH